MSLKNLRIVVIVTTLVTAVIHLSLSTLGPMMFTVLFILNGLGYIVLLLAYLGKLTFVKVPRSVIYGAYLAFAAVTIIAYFVMGSISPIGIFTKLVEVILLIALYLSMRAERGQAPA